MIGTDDPALQDAEISFNGVGMGVAAHIFADVCRAVTKPATGTPAYC
jgi:hypothetical protein